MAAHAKSVRPARTARVLLLALFGGALALVALFVAFDAAPESAGGARAQGSARADGAVELREPSELDADVAPANGAAAVEREATAGQRPLPKARVDYVDEGRASGRVVDELGSPVAKARVLAASSDRGPSAPLDGAQWEGRKALREAVTDDDGRFALDELDAGRFRLAVRADGFAPLDRDDLLQPAGGELALGELRLERGVVLAGRVVDEGGRPVAGAELVRARDASQPYRAKALDDCGPVVAVTDESGAFRVACQAVGPWTLVAHADGFLEASDSGVLAQPGSAREDLLLRLERGAEIAGRVRFAPSPNIPPFDELLVRARRTDPRPAAHPGAEFAREAPLAEGGAFRLAGVIEGHSYTLSLRRRSAEDKDAREIRPTVDALGGESDVEIAIGESRSLVFRVVGAEDGKALTKDVETRLSYSGGARDNQQAAAAREDLADGRVRLVIHEPADVADRFRLDVTARGHRAVRFPSLELPLGAESTLPDVRLEPMAIARVRVLDAATLEPVRGARVSAELVSGDSGMRPADAPRGKGGERITSDKSDRDGVCELFATLGAQGLATVSHDDYARSPAFPISFAEAGAAPFEVQVDRGATARVLVFDAQGAPLGGASVQVVTVLADPRAQGASLAVSKLARVSDPQGVCLCEPLAPARYRFYLELERMGAREMREDDPSRATADLALGETVEVVLRDPPRMRVGGRITEAGAPLAGARVTLAPDAGGKQASNSTGNWNRRIEVASDSAGRYEARGLGPGAWMLAVEHPSRVAPFLSTFELEDHDLDLDIALPRGALIGRVVDEHGGGLGGARIRLGQIRRERGENTFIPLLDGRAAVTSESSGHFELRGLPVDARIVLEASLTGYQVARSDTLAPLPDETLAGIELVLRRGARLELELTNSLSQPTRGYVSARRAGLKDRPGPSDAAFAATNARGHAVLDGLAPGKWIVRAWRRREEADRAPTHEVDLTSGANARLELELP